jgi:hypothetical protein
MKIIHCSYSATELGIFYFNFPSWIKIFLTSVKKQNFRNTLQSFTLFLYIALCVKFLSTSKLVYTCYINKYKYLKSNGYMLIIVTGMVLFFMSLEWDNVSELRPIMSLFLIPQMTDEGGEQRWHYTDRNNRRACRETSPITIMCAQISHGEAWARRRASRWEVDFCPAEAWHGCC